MTRAAPRSAGPPKPPRRNLERVAKATSALRIAAERTKANKLAQMRWLPPQHAFLTDRSRVKMIRTGNQAYGKTTVGLADLIYRCLGHHPFQPVPSAPVECWVICASFKSSVKIQKKLWELLPRDQVVIGTRFDERHGFGANAPCVLFCNGSSIHFRTTKQDVLDMAGATIDVALFDEPPRNRRVFEEVRKRVMARNGIVMISMTPINADVDWIREMAESGVITDLHFKLEPQYLIPVGEKRAIKINGVRRDEKWIAQVREDTAEWERPVTVDGEWEMRSEGNLFKAFRPAPAANGGHVSGVVPSVPLLLSLGIDHGLGTGRQTSILIGVLETPGSKYPKVWVVSETHSDGMTTTERDAEDIELMLGRMAIDWSSLDYAYGDKPTGPTGHMSTKGNLDLEDSLRRRFKLKDRTELKPRIRSAKRGRGSAQQVKQMGLRFLHELMLEGNLIVSPACAWLIECLSQWDGTDTSKHKDAIDALRYALRPWIMGERRTSAAMRVRSY